MGLLRSLWGFLRAVVRGLVAAARWWRAWVTVRDYREAAELSEKLADKFIEIRALTLFRWKVTAAVVISGVVGLLVFWVVYGDPVWLITTAVLAVVVAVLGRRRARPAGGVGRSAVAGLDDGSAAPGGGVPRRQADRQGRDAAAGRAALAGR